MRALKLFVLLVSSAAAVGAQEFPQHPSEIVPVPVTRSVPGITGSSYPFDRSTPCRVMTAYGRESVRATAGPLSIRAIRFRPRPHAGTIRTPRYRNLRLDVSTGRRPANDLDRRFDANHGPDRVTAHTSAYGAPRRYIYLGRNPTAFGLEIPFTTPFQWDPRLGPLMIDLRHDGAIDSSVPYDARNSSDVGTIRHRSNSNASVADSPVSGTATTALCAELILDRETAPAGIESSEGTLESSYPWGRDPGTEMRLQEVYDANTTGLSRATRITHLAWRTDLGNAWNGSRTFDVRVSLSTGAPNLSSTITDRFESNHGADKTVVFDGLWTPDSSPGTSSGPSAFSQVMRLETPFDYSPEVGSLVVDFQLRGSSGPAAGWFDLLYVPGVGRAVHRSRANPTIATTTQPYALALCVLGVPQPVAPSVADRVDGNTRSAIPWGASQMRVQYGYDRSAVRVARTMNITHLGWRPDGRRTSIGPARYRARISLSTFPQISSALMSTNFLANHGADRTTVFDGVIAVPYRALTGTGPQPWELSVQLDRPFRWNPFLGPLLVDVQSERLSGGLDFYDAVDNNSVLGVTSVWHRSNRFASIADSSVTAGGLVLKLGGIGANGDVESTGSACRNGSGRAPLASTVGRPWTGNRDFAFSVSNGPASANASLLLGLPTTRALNLGPLGLPACTLYVQGTFMSIGATVMAGVGTSPFPIALDSSVAGMEFGSQWAILDSSAQGGATLSNHVRIAIDH